MASIVMLLVSAAFVASSSGFLLDDTNCQDLHQSCAYWAGIGECTKNPNYMLESCKESCGKCGSTDPVEECYHKDRPQDYKGNKSTSATGRQCLAWNTIGGPPAQYFGDGKLPTNNFCRDIFYTKQGDNGPTPQNGEPWCYTGPTAADEEVCGVPVCQAMTPKTPTLTKDKTNPVTVGITEIFMCSSDSFKHLRPTYRFFQNGVEVQTETKPVWVIDPVSLSDNNDVYTCTLEMGGLNSLSSNNVTLAVVDA